MKIRRFMAVLLAVLTAAALGGQLWAAAADEVLDTGKECSLTVKPCDDTAANKDMAEDLATVDIVLDLYKVADWKVEQTKYSFVAIEPFKLDITREMTGGGWTETAQAATGTAMSADVKPYMAEVKAGDKVKLPSGLYLLIAHVRGDTDYMKTVTDKDGNSSIVTRVKTEKHTYTFMPELVSLPSKAPEDSEINTANPGNWIYDLTVSMKPQRDGLKGQLEIVKTLLAYETSAPATFVFRIDWEEDGKPRSDVRTLTFTAPGVRSLLVDDLPVGATVTVTEVYSGAVYTIVGSGEQTAVIEADKTARVEFTNDYDENDHPNGGGSITNRFTYDKEDGWVLDKLVDNTGEYDVIG